MPRNRNQEDQEPTPGVSIPYTQGVSERLDRVFRKHGARVFHKPTRTLKSRLVRVKDKTADAQRSGVIYQLQCEDCDANYIGETARPLGKRESEHRSRSDSAVFEHTNTSDHSFGPSSVLDTEDNSLKRKVKEAINIKQLQPSLNRDNGYSLAPIYDSVLKAPQSDNG